MTPQKDIAQEDRLDLVFSVADTWTKENPYVHIGIYNNHPEGNPINLQIVMKEQDQISCFSEEYKKRYDVFTAVF